MLKPTDIERIKGKNSRYAVVVGVAKRAREIAEKAEEEGVILTEKPVSMAINDFADGDYEIIVNEPEEAAGGRRSRDGVSLTEGERGEAPQCRW